jgi:hypothetical protein
MPGVSDEEWRACRGCGARFERKPWALDEDVRASPECWQAYGELRGLATADGTRLDGAAHLSSAAYFAQHGGEPTPPISVAHGLVGLYLALEVGLDGDAVLALLARAATTPANWPEFEPPSGTGVTTVADVLREVRGGAPDGPEPVVRRWAGEVWESWADRRDDIVQLVDRLFPGEFAR